MRRLLWSTLLVLAAAGGLAGEAAARSGACVGTGGPQECTVWNGRVTSIDDGDTLRVDLFGDGQRAPIKVRITGIQAMEQTVYSPNPARRRGACHALEATARLERLVRRSRGRVRLSAQDPSSRSGVRWRRSVAVRIGGRWQDVGRKLISEGHALWLANTREYAWNAEYSLLAERAAAGARGLWNPAYCGAGPSATSPLRVLVNADADGNDKEFVNGEWIRIRNLDPVNDVHLGGWWVRDSALRRFVFPEWATLPPGETLTVYAGEGTHTWTEFFWGQESPVFENAGRGGRALGDGGYLFDPQGDLRAWMTYPCRENCTDPYEGAVKVTAKPRGREKVMVRNVGAATIDLDGYRLQSPPYSYPFPRASLLAPGDEMEIEVRGDPAEDSALLKHWGEPGPILDNGGDRIRLSNFRGVVLDCYAYGDASC